LCCSIFCFLFSMFWITVCPLVIALSVLRFTAFDYRLGIFKNSVSFGHCIVCPSIYGFWLPPGIFKLPCFLVIVMSVLQYTLLITPWYIQTTVFSGHCNVCPSIYGFWLPPWYNQAILKYMQSLVNITLMLLFPGKIDLTDLALIIIVLMKFILINCYLAILAVVNFQI
jgi:hypothetical protein